MNRRRVLIAGALAVVLAGVAWHAPGGHRPVTVDALAGWLRAGGNVLVAVVVVTALLVLAHQYRRWHEYRPAIHVAMLLVVFVVGTSLWLDTSDPTGASGTLSAGEESTIRVAALGLLFAVLLTLAHHFDGDDR